MLKEVFVIPNLVQGKFKPDKGVMKTLKRSITAKPFNELAAIITATWMENPEMSTKDLWIRFKRRLEDVVNLAEFRRQLLRAGISKNRINDSVSVTDQVTATIETLSKLKARKAEEHVRKVSSAIDKAHKVVEDIEPTEKNIGKFLGVVHSLNDLGRKTYDIKEEINPNDKMGNLSVLLNVSTIQEEKIEKAKPAKVTVIDDSVTEA